MIHIRRTGILVAVLAVSINNAFSVEPSISALHGLFSISNNLPDDQPWQIFSRRMYGAGGAKNVQWIENDQRVVCGDYFGGSRVFDATNWRIVDILPSRRAAGAIVSKLSPNGRWVATAGRDNKLHFRSADGELLATRDLTFPSRMEWSPGGNRLAAIENYRRVRIWLRDGVKDLDLGETSTLVSSLAWSPNGRLLAVGARDGIVHVWNLPPPPVRDQTGNFVRRQVHPVLEPTNIETQHKSPLVSWASDNTLATHSYGDPIQLWTDDGQKDHTIEREKLYRFRWSPDGRLLAINHNQRLEVCDPDGSNVRESIDMPDGCGNFAWSEDSQRLAILSNRMSLYVWNVRSEHRPTKVVSGHNDNLSSAIRCPVQWSADGELLTSGSRDAAIRVWNVAGSPVASWVTPGQRAAVVSLQPSGKVLASYSWPARITRFWKLDGTELPTKSESDAHMGLKWHPDGKQFAAPTQRGGFVRFFDSSGKHVHTSRHGNSLRVNSLSWSRDGKWLATAPDSERPPTIRLWSGDGSRSGILNGSPEPIAAISWHPNNQGITSISKEHGEVRHWRIDGTMGESIAAHGASGSVQWSPDGRFLATYSGRRIRIYDSSDQEVAALSNVNAFVRRLLWSPDSTRMAFQTVNGIHVYDLKGQLVTVCSGMRLASESATWSPDGATIACPTFFNTMIVWDAKTGRTKWVGFPLSDGKSATVTAGGELLTDDRRAFDKEYFFMQQGLDGHAVFRDSREFETAFALEYSEQTEVDGTKY